MFRKDFEQTASKWTVPGAVGVMMGRIIWESVWGTVTGLKDIIGGTATGEDAIHVTSMAALLLTGGSSGLATAGKTAAKGLGKANSVRAAGKALSSAIKASRAQALGKGASNVLGIQGTERAARNIGRTSTYAQRFEYVFNPEEIPYELIGDHGIGAVKSLLQNGYIHTKNWNAHKAVDKRIAKLDKVIASIKEQGGDATQAAQALERIKDGVVSGKTEIEIDAAPQSLDNLVDSAETYLETLEGGNSDIQNEDDWEAHFLSGLYGVGAADEVEPSPEDEAQPALEDQQQPVEAAPEATEELIVPDTAPELEEDPLTPQDPEQQQRRDQHVVVNEDLKQYKGFLPD